MGKRVLSIFLAAVMIFTSMDLTVLASEVGSEVEEAYQSDEVSLTGEDAVWNEEEINASEESSETVNDFTESEEEVYETDTSTDYTQRPEYSEDSDVVFENDDELQDVDLEIEEVVDETDEDATVEENDSVEIESGLIGGGNTAYSTSSLNNEVTNKLISYKGKWPNESNTGVQCLGFVQYLANDIFGSNPGLSAVVRSSADGKVSNGWTCHVVTSNNIPSVEPGDIIDAPTGGSSHTAIVLSVSSNGTITCVQCNIGTNCIVYWGDEYSSNSSYRYFNYTLSNKTLKNIYDKLYGKTGEAATSDGKIRVWKPSDSLKQNAKAYGGTGASTLKISGQSSPSTLTQGSSFSCKGTITSNYKITHVAGYILKFKGSEENVVYSKTVNPNSTSYSLANSDIDKALLFNKLTAGTYYYKITAHDASGNRLTLINAAFNVSGTSTLSINGETSPGNLMQGTSWTCTGTISSNFNITHVGCYILQINNGNEKVIYEKTISPNSTIYSLNNSDVNNALQFEKLAAGTYYYSITAHDSSGQRSYMIYKEFKVTAPESTLSISGGISPGTLTQGSSWTCKGTITSNYNITHVGCYILQFVNGVEKVIYEKTINPNSKSYSLENSDVNNALLFHKLPVGTYYYSITAHDASGKRSYMIYEEFKVVAPESTLKISGENYPSDMKQGTSWISAGTISSNYNITHVGCYILQVVNGVENIICEKTINPNTTSYSLGNSDINNALRFDQLSPGTYYYKITAHDTSGTKLTLINQIFTIERRCTFSGEIASPADDVVNTSSVTIQILATDICDMITFTIKISGDMEKGLIIDSIKSGSSFECNYDIELPVEGSYTVTVDALCDHGYSHSLGSRTFVYEMPEDEPEISGVEDKVYTGSAIKQDINLYYNNMLLKEGIDYTLTYKNNINAYTYTEEDYANFESKLNETGKRVSNGSFNPGKAPQVTIKMKGNYCGSQTVYYQIKPADIKNDTINVDSMTVTYSGKKQTPVPTIAWNGRKLKYGTDFSIPGYDAVKSDKTTFTQSGSYQLAIEGKNNFSGEIPITLTISDNSNQIAINKVNVKGVKAGAWTGEQIVHTNFTVSYKKDILSVENGDFEVSYGENTAVGTGTITLIGTGLDTDGDGYSYVGTKTISFKITGISMNKVTIKGVNKSYSYTGVEINPEAALTYKANKSDNEVILVKDVNYTVTYKNNQKKGTAAIVFTGLESGGYTGVKKTTFKINASGIDSSKANVDSVEDIKVAFKDSANMIDGVYTAAYMKGGVKPEVIVTSGDKKLELGMDYTLKYSNNTKVALSTDMKSPTVTVTGKGNYSGSKQMHFSIIQKPLTNENGIRVVADDKVESAKKNGYYQNFKVYDADGKTLSTSDYDSRNIVYTLVQTKNEDGTVVEVNEVLDKNYIVLADSVIQIAVQGKGNYEGGTATGTYRIVKSNCDISKATIQINNQTYTGEAIEITEQSQFKTGKIFINNGKETQVLTLGTDIEVVPGSYVKNVDKGTAKVTFRGINSYGGTKTVSYKIGMRSIMDFFK